MRRLLATGAAVAVAGMLASGATSAQPNARADRLSTAVSDTVAASEAPPVEVAPDLSTRPLDAIQGPVTRTSTIAAARLSPAGNLDIPPLASTAYQRAAQVMAVSSPACRLPWTLLAAIGRVESDHGQSGGARLDADGVARPAILGHRLNGHGVARIPDTDAGTLDRDKTWDRAVGPMQLIPSTWRAVAVDGDGDGVRNPEDIDDAALGAAVLLCAGGGDLSTPAGASAAVFRYNASKHYVAVVLAYEHAYATAQNRPVGVVQLPTYGPAAPVDARETPAAKPHRPHAKPAAPSSKPTPTTTHSAATGPTATHTQPAKPKPTQTDPPTTTVKGTLTKLDDGSWQLTNEGTDPVKLTFTDATKFDDGDGNAESSDAELAGMQDEPVIASVDDSTHTVVTLSLDKDAPPPPSDSPSPSPTASPSATSTPSEQPTS